MPKDENMLVSHQLSLKATPANGPPTNFIVAAKATAKYSEIFNIYIYEQRFWLTYYTFFENIWKNLT